MTIQQTLKVVPFQEEVKFASLETRRGAEGNDLHQLRFFRRFGEKRVWSRFPGPVFFLRGTEDQVKGMRQTVEGLPEGSLLLVTFEPRMIKEPYKGKSYEDDGNFNSYWWNITSIAIPTITSAPKVPQSEKAPEMPAQEEPPAIDGTMPRSNWAETQALIAASWSIDQARQIVTIWAGTTKPESWDAILKEIAELAPRFLAMRKFLASKDLR